MDSSVYLVIYDDVHEKMLLGVFSSSRKAKQAIRDDVREFFDYYKSKSLPIPYRLIVNNFKGYVINKIILNEICDFSLGYN